MKKKWIEKLRRPNKNRSFFSYILFAIIFGMIVLVFAFMTPGGGGLGAYGSGTAAVVGGRVVPFSVLQQRVRMIEQRRKAFMPQGADQFRKFFERQALNDLINSEVLSEIKYVEGLLISDAELARYIMEIPIFQKDGVFQRDRYESYLADSGRSPYSLEKDIRKDMRMSQVQSLFSYSFKPLDFESQLKKEIQKIQFSFNYVDVSNSVLKKTLKVGSSKVQSYLRDHLPKVQKEYDQDAFSYREKAKVKVRMILILAADGSDEAMGRAQEKLEEISQDLTVDNFATKAEEFSEDPTSSEGGDLGFVEQGTYGKDWEKVVFSTDVGSITPAFKTELGWAKVLIEEKKEEIKKPFDSVKDKIAKKLIFKEELKSFRDQISNFLKEGKSQDLTQLLKTKGLKWKNTGFFNVAKRNIPGLGSSGDVFEKALGLSKKDELYPDLISTGGRSLILKRAAIKEKVSDGKKSRSSSMTQRSNTSLSQWFDLKRKSMKIRINPILEFEEPSLF